MVSIIEKQFRTASAGISSTNSFRVVIEDHLDYFRNHPSTTTAEITSHDANVYVFDWIGLLNKLGVSADLHWLTIRMNGGVSYTDVGEDSRVILIPDAGEFNRIAQMHTSARKKK